MSTMKMALPIEIILENTIQKTSENLGNFGKPSKFARKIYVAEFLDSQIIFFVVHSF